MCSSGWKAGDAFGVSAAHSLWDADQKPLNHVVFPFPSGVLLPAKMIFKVKSADAIKEICKNWGMQKHSRNLTLALVLDAPPGKNVHPGDSGTGRPASP